ncbi:hypothetical protein [Arhodomonas sp. AD133]|uniref:hypothetical protein n=1 Tax=Arhodomonas sp. AD133 TaxID=3415009 RepID=UPI003EBA9F65
MSADDPFVTPPFTVTPDEPEDKTPPPAQPGPSGHIANADTWVASVIEPDYCEVGDKVVAFQSTAEIDTDHLASSNVIINNRPVYRVGDMHRGIDGDAGEHLVSKTSGETGYVRFLDGQDDVIVNSQPVVRHGSAVQINCDESGKGGARGELLTEQAMPATPAPGNRVSPELQALLDERADDRSLWERASDYGGEVWERTKDVASASWEQPLETAKGMGKAVVNTPSDLYNLAVASTKYAPASQLYNKTLDYLALRAYDAGNLQRANELATQSREIEESGYVDDILSIDNDAQQGGAVASIFIPGVGWVRGPATAGKVARTARGAEEAASVARGAEKATSATRGAEEAASTTRADDAANAPRKPRVRRGVHANAARAEAAAHERMVDLGYKPLGNTNGRYRPGQKGIDGVYSNPNPPPDYVITEAKYNKGRLHRTLDGRQMSNDWITGNDRLRNAGLSPDEVQAITRGVKEGTVERVLVRVKPNDTMRMSRIDDSGYVVPGNAGKFP